MIKFLNVLLVGSVLGSATMMYSLEHFTRGLEREITRVSRLIDEEKEADKLLKAEWSSLTRPERIEKIALDVLKLRPVTATQIVSQRDLPGVLAESGSLGTAGDQLGALVEAQQ